MHFFSRNFLSNFSYCQPLLLTQSEILSGVLKGFMRNGTNGKQEKKVLNTKDVFHVRVQYSFFNVYCVPTIKAYVYNCDL